MIHKKSIIITCLILVQIIHTTPGHIIIEIDDQKTEEQALLLAKKQTLRNYLNQERNQQWAESEGIMNCCCLTAICLPCTTVVLDPFMNVEVSPQTALISTLSAFASVLAIAYCSQPNFSKQEQEIEKIDEMLKEKFE